MEFAVEIIALLFSLLGAGGATKLFEAIQKLAEKPKKPDLIVNPAEHGAIWLEGTSTPSSSAVADLTIRTTAESGVYDPSMSTKHRIDMALRHLSATVADAQREMVKNRRLEVGQRWAGYFLTIGEYTVAGLLTVGSIKEGLDKTVIGGLAIIVTVSASIRAHIDPGRKSQTAFDRQNEFEKVIKQSADRKLIIQAKKHTEEEVLDLLLELLERLTSEIFRIKAIRSR